MGHFESAERPPTEELAAQSLAHVSYDPDLLRHHVFGLCEYNIINTPEPDPVIQIIQ